MKRNILFILLLGIGMFAMGCAEPCDEDADCMSMGPMNAVCNLDVTALEACEAIMFFEIDGYDLCAQYEGIPEEGSCEMDFDFSDIDLPF